MSNVTALPPPRPRMLLSSDRWLAAWRSSLITSLRRYQRSHGLWLLLLIAPVGARFMISDEQGRGVAIGVGEQLPVLTSPVLGVWLGIVVSTLLLPIGYIYLRANTTRRQPWQIEEITIASRIAMMIGRFMADSMVLLAMLATLTTAGWFLGWLMVSGPLNLWHISYALWLVAAPALIGLAAIRMLFDSLPWLRGAFGDFCYFVLWMTSIVAPAAVGGQVSSFTSNLYDFPGFVRPMVGPSPIGDNNLTIGGFVPKLGRISIDVMAGLDAPGYAPSRAAWVAIAGLLVIFAGLIYRPHRPSARRRGEGRLARLLAAGPPPAARLDAPPAPASRFPLVALVAAEYRLIGAGRLFKLLALAAALAGLFGDYRHIGSAAALLLLIFGMCAHAGRSEARGLGALTATALLPPLTRRIAFVVAAALWSLALALPAAIIRVSAEPLLQSLLATTAAALLTTLLATASRSAFAPRIVLLIIWYGYVST